MPKTNFIVKYLETLAELKELCLIFSETFEQKYSQEKSYLQQILSNENAIILVAVLHHKIIGGVVGFIITPLTGSKELYLYDIAVHPNFQKQGIGTSLLQKLKKIAQKKNIRTIFVEAEEDDDGAVAFYRKMNGEELAVSHFNFEL